MPIDDSAPYEAVEPRRSAESSLDASLRHELAALHSDAWGWAVAVTRGDVVEAEEVLQLAYLRILDGSAVFHRRSEFKTWVFGVIRRVAVELVRRRQWRDLRRAEPQPAVAAAPSREPGPADSLAHAQLSSRLHDALGQLSERQRQVLHLVFYQDMTIAEAAEVLGIGFGSARTHYARGKRNLRQVLRSGEGGA